MDHPISKEAEIAKLLILLRKETQKSIENATGIRTTNLSAWLRGKPQSISLARVSLLLNHLGVSQMKLSKDRLHDWQVPIEDPEVLPRLLDLLGERDFSRATLYTALLRAWHDMDTHVLVIDSFGPTAVIRIKEDQTTYNGFFVDQLSASQNITVRNDLDTIPGDTALEFKVNLEKLADVFEYSSTPEFKKLRQAAKEKKPAEPRVIPADGFDGLSAWLTQKDKLTLARPLLRHLSSGVSVEEIAQAIDKLDWANLQS